ncbi:MAG TPA: cytochrome c [Wenzhouxiangella sp.]|nr:cytochrome c [Wenzhouxiangella sp.]
MSLSRTILLAFFIGTLSTAATAAGDKGRGLEKSKVCQACHGEDGNLAVDDQTPILAGQYADYLIHALKDYRSGERVNAVMNGFAGDLSDQDIEDLAAWYSSQKGLATPSLSE